MMRAFFAFSLLLPLTAPGQITETRSSLDFQGSLSQIEGDVDPASLSTWQNHPSYPAPEFTLNGDGTLTLVTPDDDYPNWNLVTGDFLDSAIGWTWETRFRIDSANDPERGVWEIFLRNNESGLATTRIHFLSTGIDRDNTGNGRVADIPADLTDDFHVVRGAVEAGTNLTTVWLDGVIVVDAMPSNEFDASESGWLGRWGAQTRGGTTTIDYIRFDTTGAYAPGEPIRQPLTVGISLDSVQQATLAISSSPGDLFDIYRTVDLESGFGTPVATDVPVSEPTTELSGVIDDLSGSTTLVDDESDFDALLTPGVSYVLRPGDGANADQPSEVLSWSGSSITLVDDYGSDNSWSGAFTIETAAWETLWIDEAGASDEHAFYQVRRQ